MRFCVCLVLLLATGSLFAQPYPAKPIRLIVPFGTGGSNDIVARLLGPKLSESLGQPVIVENRPGAGGTVGTDAVVKSAPDGYTLMIGATSTIAANVGLYPKRNFDPVRDLTPITEIADGAFLMAVPASSPAKTVKEFVELARTSPGKLNYGTSGKGSSMHLMGELFKMTAHVDMVHVPYKAGGPAIADLATDRVQLVYSDLAALLPFVRSGQVRALAVTTPKRSALLPDLPTMAEAGLPGCEATSWYGILGPAGLPRDITMKLNGELARIVHSPDTKERFATLGTEPVTGTPEQFAQFIQAEVKKWSAVSKAAGVELE
ncbi:MAG TPA: tripartite tricarboxylate transporter substrate binding protein [Burkholderiales bacterium]|nr:tripartite tricarboxylate transporter substrate binding protein [Burkholderiales bacterium]